jgi:hypothetical protein
MKQNSQWLSQVRTRSNTAECTSTERLPRPLGHLHVELEPWRTTSSTGSASSVSTCHSMTSRGTSPSMRAISSPGSSPARAAGESGATRTTSGNDMGRVRLTTVRTTRPSRYPGSHHERRPGAARRTPGLLRRASRWRSRPWRGWCGPSSRPCTATTRSSTTRSGGRALRGPGGGLRRRHRRGPAGPADHAVGPRLGPRGGRRRPASAAATWSTPCARWSPRCTTRSRSGRQGLPDRLRRPRGPRGGGRHHGRGPRRHPPGRVGRRGRRPPRLRRAGGAARPDHAQSTATGRACSSATRERFPDCGRPAAATCASPPPTASRAAWRSPRAATPSSSSARRTRRTPGPREAGPRAGLPRVYRVNVADELPDDLSGTVGVTAGASAPRSWSRR